MISSNMDRENIYDIVDAYKEQIFSKLYELVPSRLERLDRGVFEGKTTEEVLALVYMQGVAEALDAFNMEELLRAIARAEGNPEGIQA